MKPGPKVVADIILGSLALDESPATIVDITTKIIVSNGWQLIETAAMEQAEKWQARTLHTLRSEVGKLQELGRPVRIAFNSSSDYMVQGACFIEPKDSDVLQASKRRRLRSERYYRYLLRLTPDQFEILCGKLIELLGVSKAVVTRRSADEGIDFYGQLSLESIFFPHDLTPTVQKQLSIWLVGQAKRYIATQSGTSEIRDLVGAINLGRAQTFGSARSPFPDLKIRVVDPVFALLITTGSISSNAWKLLERSGVIGMDGEMVAAFLADREVALTDGEFNQESLSNWLKSGLPW